MFFELKKFFGSFSFYSGIVKTIAVLLCAFVGWKLGFIASGLTAAITIIMISPSDIPGNRKHHLGGIAIATIFVAISLICIELTRSNLYLLLPTMGILIFGFAYFSLYGMRASMISIAGIFSVALTFAQERHGMELWYATLSIILAGAGYIAMIQVFMWIKPRHYSEQLLGNCMQLTAEFFNVRASLLVENNLAVNKQKLLNLQTQINDAYEKLRDVLLDSQSKSGKTNYLQRQFLIFIELVDIFEFAVANPIPYQKAERLSNKNLVSQYAYFLKESALILTELSQYIGKRKIVNPVNSLENSLEKWEKSIKNYANEFDFKEKSEEIAFLNNLYQYAKRQSQKIDQIVRIFANYYTKEISFRDEKTFRKFVSTQNYSLRLLLDNLSLESPIFRHALRLSIVTIIGFLIGKYFELQNSYWILFTIYVIMRPGYATTKKRSKDRIIGTIIGAIASATIIVICQYSLQLENYVYVYAVIIVLCMPFAYGLLQENFNISVIFITIYIILIYAIFVDNALGVLQYRVIDTVIGVGLSLLANHLIFPSWEHKQYKTLIINSLKHNIAYINEVVLLYKNPQIVITDYKVARKKAFLSLANLNAGLQRMLQEPKSKQKNYAQFNKFVVLQQDFLSALSAMALQRVSFDKVLPDDLFVRAMKQIQSKLKNTLSLAENSSEKTPIETQVFDDIDLFIKTSKKSQSKDYQGIIFYKEQLFYLFSLSEYIQQNMAELNEK